MASRVSKEVLNREKWAKFGKCTGVEGMEAGITMISNEDIKLNLYCHEKPIIEEDVKSEVVSLKITCRNCGKGGHFTSKCKETQKEVVPIPKISAQENSQVIVYTLYVSNVEEETTQADLWNLFKPFGNLTKVYLPKSKSGFALVSFSKEENSKDAISRLNGRAYGKLILSVQVSKYQE